MKWINTSKNPWKRAGFLIIQKYRGKWACSQEPMQQAGAHLENVGGKPLSVNWKPLSHLRRIGEQQPCILIMYSQLHITMNDMIFTWSQERPICKLLIKQ